MSRTTRKHQSKARAKQVGGQPKLRSLSARAAWERGGAGVMGIKTNKQMRAADKRALRRESQDI